jgi:hypothetical protein
MTYVLACFPASPLPSLRPIPLANNPALEQPAPFGTYGGRITQEFLVHRLREARVGRLEHVWIHEPQLDWEDVRKITAGSKERSELGLLRVPHRDVF